LSEQSKALLGTTSAPQGAPALLVLADGTVFEGYSCAAPGEVFGEISFDTSMIGYEEVIADAANAGKIVCMTYPQIGNYGVNRGDLAAGKALIGGMVVRALCQTPSNWRSEVGLAELLCEQGIVAVEGVDTRMLTQHIRDCGTQLAVLSTLDGDPASLGAKLRERQGGSAACGASAQAGAPAARRAPAPAQTRKKAD